MTGLTTKQYSLSNEAEGPVFDEAGATNVAGLYLIGDLVVGKKGGSIITAFNSAVHAMKRICMHDLPCNSRLLRDKGAARAAE
jgi:thioredoxin reductase